MNHPFNEGGVSINHSHLNVAGQFFPLKYIQRIDVQEPKRNFIIPGIFIIAGIVLMLFSANAFVLLITGILLIGIGFTNLAYQRNVYRLFLVMPKGRFEVLTSRELDFIKRVAAYIEKQIK